MTQRNRTSAPRSSWIVGLSVAAALWLVAAACGGTEQESAKPQPLDPPVLVTAVPPAGSALSYDEYFVAIINADAESGECASNHESDLNDEAPEEPTAAWVLEYPERYVVGTIDCHAPGEDTVAGLVPPAPIAGLHNDYVAARQAFWSLASARADAAESSEDWSAITAEIFFAPGPEFTAIMTVFARRA